MSVALVVAIAAGILAARLAGMFVLSVRRPSALLLRVLTLTPPTVVAAVIALVTFTRGRELMVDARVAGVAAAAVAAWRRAPVFVLVPLAAAVTAAVRAAS